LMARTFLMIKPRAVSEGHAGEIIAAVERLGFEIAGIASRRLTVSEAERFYDAHRGKPFFESLVAFVTSGPTVGLMLEAPDAVPTLRRAVGATDPREAEPGTIRAAYGKSVTENAVHASDSPASVLLESAIFFDDCPRALVG
jgi:nucleoside-diphosphate kinase